MSSNLPFTFIFIGPSGCGKGTQVKLLQNYLSEKYPEFAQFYLQSGNHFREFVKGNTYAADIARDALNTGERQPDFLAMWIWSNTFINNLHGNEHLIIDGSPRSLNEAQNLDMAFKFFKRTQPKVIFLDVSMNWALERMLGRAKEEGRADDTEEGIKKRLDWYQRDVFPVVEYYKRDRDYDFYQIDGERSIEDVHREIISKVFGEIPLV